MTLAEAISDMERLCASWAASPPEIKCLVLFALVEIDRQRAAARNPGMMAVVEAVDTKTMQAIVAENRGSGIPAPSSLATSPGAWQPELPRGTGWIDPLPLRSPPGVDILDRMMDVQDARDKLERIHQTNR
jgi:hypothetical protein